MNDDPLEEMPFDESELTDVESLVKKMSLKQPKAVVQFSGSDRRLVRRGYWRELLVAVACLVIGFFCGRIDRMFSDNATGRTAIVADRDELNGSESQGKPGVALVEQVVKDELKSQPAVHLVDQGVYFINGQIPVRTYEAYLQKKVTVPDPQTGKPVEVVVPVREIVVASSPCT